MKTYRITLLASTFDMASSPPAILWALWPTFDGWPSLLSPQECIVTAPASAPAPADLGPLVRVELLPDSPQG